MRVLVDALADFEESPARETEELVGPLDQTRTLSARGGGTTVTLEGEGTRGGGGGRGGSPVMMGFAEWGKGSKVATASHILLKEWFTPPPSQSGSPPPHRWRRPLTSCSKSGRRRCGCWGG